MNNVGLEPGSDEWFLSALGEELAERACFVTKMFAWYEGDAPLPVPDSEQNKDNPEFKRMREHSRLNIAPLIVESRLPRMRVNSVQTAVDDSPDGDDIVREIIQTQDLRSKLRLAFRDALVTGRGYLVATVDGIMHSSPYNTVAMKDAFGNIIAALTVYVDIEKQQNVMLLARPGYTREARSESRFSLPNTINKNIDGSPYNTWVWVGSNWELGERQETGLDRIPIYEFDLGKGILAKHVPTLMRINHTIFQSQFLFASQAFRQRGIIGAPMTDDMGKEIDYSPELFTTAPDALWMLPEGSQLWESGQADMNPILNSITSDVRRLAVESKTPLFMISPDDANGSATGATLQGEILAFDIEELEDIFTATLKRLFSDTLVSLGEEERADPTQMVIDWVNPRRPSLTEIAASIQQIVSVGVPLKFALKKVWGLSPEEVEEIMREVSVNKLLDSVAAQGNQSEEPSEEEPPEPPAAQEEPRPEDFEEEEQDK